MVKTFNIKFPAFTGVEKRRLYVYTPRSYNKEPEKRYPVLYMFDGHNVFFDSDAAFGKSWGLKEYLDANRVDLIVVALECNQNPDEARMYEYAPFEITVPQDWNVEFRNEYYGNETLRWFVRKLKPMIDANYRTLKSRKYTFLAGSSMGGLIAAYGVIKFNRYFSRGAALSPAFQISCGKMQETIYESNIAKNTILYMDYGTKDLDLPLALDEFRDVNYALMEKGVLVTSRVILDGRHSEADWQRQLPYVIRTLMQGIQEW